MENVKIVLAEGVNLPEFRTKEGANFDIKIHSFKKVYKGKSQVDLKIALRESIKNGYITLRPFERVLVGTGISMVLPTGLELQVRTHPAISLPRNIVVFNSPCGADPSYSEEITVLLYNSSQYLSKVKIGDIVAQGVFSYFQRPVFEWII